MIAADFLGLFEHPAPGLVFKGYTEVGFPPRFAVAVTHQLHGPPSKTELAQLEDATSAIPMTELRDFYSVYTGADLCVRFDRQRERDLALLGLKPVETWKELTADFQSGGEWAWTIDHNSYQKTPSLYRGPDSWLIFAVLRELPCCLSVFLNGPHAGSVFYLAPEPGFNIIRPIARSFKQLLVRIASDPAAFLRLCRCHGVFAAQDGRGGFFGLDPEMYVADLGSRNDLLVMDF